MKYLYSISLILTVIGAINWGLVGVAHFDLVAYLFGTMSSVTRVVYALVGIAGVIVLASMSGWAKKG